MRNRGPHVQRDALSGADKCSRATGEWKNEYRVHLKIAIWFNHPLVIVNMYGFRF